MGSSCRLPGEPASHLRSRPALVVLLSIELLHTSAQRVDRPDIRFTSYLGLQGLTMLLIEALRGDSLLLPGGVRAAQVVGLALLLLAISRLKSDHS